MKHLHRICLILGAVCLFGTVLLVNFFPEYRLPITTIALMALLCMATGFLGSLHMEPWDRSERSLKQWLQNNSTDLDSLFCLYISLTSKGVYESCLDRQEREDVYRKCERTLQKLFGTGSVQRMTHNEFAVLRRFPLAHASNERSKSEYQRSVCQHLSENLTSLVNQISTPHLAPLEITIGCASSGMRYHMDTAEQLVDLAYTTQRQARAEYANWLVADEHIRARKLDIDECKQGFLNEGWEHDFNPFFQPIVDPETFMIIGSESLARWQMGGFRILAAQIFKDVAAELQHIAAIDQVIITKTLSTIRALMRSRLLPYTFKVVINVSNESLIKGFADQMLFLTTLNGLSPSQIEFDMTDSAFSKTESLSVIRELRALDFRVSLDIFEDTAFDLQAFERADFDTIKLDFVVYTPALRQVYVSLIDAARQKGVEVVAKGIEQKEILEAAIELGCTYVQGNYFTLPIPEQAFQVFMKKYQEGLYVGSLG